MTVSLLQDELVEILTKLRRHVVICEASTTSFNEAVTMQPTRFTTTEHPTDEERDEVKQCLMKNWQAGASDFCNVRSS